MSAPLPVDCGSEPGPRKAALRILIGRCLMGGMGVA